MIMSDMMTTNDFQMADVRDLMEVLMLRFLTVIETNSFALEEPCEKSRKRIHQYDLDWYISKQQVGTVLFLAPSYFNHSCDPNACFVFDKK